MAETTTELAALVEAYVAEQFIYLNEERAWAGGSVSDPDSFDENGVPGGGGYYPRTLSDGTVAYIPCPEKLSDIVSNVSQNQLDEIEAILATGTVSALIETRVYSTKAALDADLVPDDGDYALVTFDSNAAYNGLYKKSGATTTGSWTGPSTIYSSVKAGAEAARDLSRLYAVSDTNASIPGAQSSADRGSKYYSDLSAISATTSTNKAAEATTAASDATNTVSAVKATAPGTTASIVKTKLLDCNIYNGDPTKFYHFGAFYYTGPGGSMRFQIYQSNDKVGTGAALVADLFVNPANGYTGERLITVTPFSTNTIIFELRIDFEAGAAWSGNIFSGGTYANAGISQKCVINRTPFINEINRLADIRAIKFTNVAQGVFSDYVEDTLLRYIFRDIKIYGGDPTHQYIISKLETASYRITIEVTDITAGVIVAQYSLLSPNYTTVSRHIRLAKGALPHYTGIYIYMNVDWAKLVELSGVQNAVRTYTTAVQAGIHSKNVYTVEDIRQRFLEVDDFKEIIHVGAASWCNFTTLRAAVESLYDDGAYANPLTDTTDKYCSRAHLFNQILIKLVDRGTSMQSLIAAAGNYKGTNIYLPDFVSIEGLGPEHTMIASEAPTGSRPNIQGHLNHKIRNLSILSDTSLDIGGGRAGQYCWHRDVFNKFATPSTAVGLKNTVNWTHTAVAKNVTLIGGVSQNAPLLGGGVSNGQYDLFEDVTTMRLNSNANAEDLLEHTNIGMVIPATVHLRRVKSLSINQGTTMVNPQCLAGGGVKSTLILEDTDIERIYTQNSFITGSTIPNVIDDLFEWDIIGSPANGVVYYNDARSYVLTVPGNATVSGTAVASILGTIDVNGYGSLFVMDGIAYGSTPTNRGLGYRLGDCSTVNKTLTVNGVTHTFNINYTARTNAQVETELAATFGVGVVVTKRKDNLMYPKIGNIRQVKNDVVSQILPQIFYKRTSHSTIAVANDMDTVAGFTMSRIPNGAIGNGFEGKRFAARYIESIGSNVGQFRISNGVPVFTGIDATHPAKGEVLYNGMVVLY